MTEPDEPREVAWARLMSRYGRPLRAYLRRTQADEVAVEDMLWDVWALAVDSEAEIFDADDPWLLFRRLGRQVARMQVRRSRREQRLTTDVQVEANSDLVGAPAERQVRAPILAWQATALAMLTERQRVIVDLRYRYSIPDEVIALALGISESTLRVHAKRALDRLRAYAQISPPRRIWKG